MCHATHDRFRSLTRRGLRVFVLIVVGSIVSCSDAPQGTIAYEERDVRNIETSFARPSASVDAVEEPTSDDLTAIPSYDASTLADDGFNPLESDGADDALSDLSEDAAMETVETSSDPPIDLLMEPDGPTIHSLTISFDGPGAGLVSSTLSGIECEPICRAALTEGTVVELVATSDPGSVFSGWSGAGCVGTDICTITMMADESVTATFGKYNPVFVTTGTYVPYEMAGLSGADAICHEEAAAAGLQGNFVAWLSTSTVDAASRIEGARGWVRSDSQPFADLPEDLVSSISFYPPSLDPAGNPVPNGAIAVTGTTSEGTLAWHQSCLDWESPATETSSEWVAGGNPRTGAYSWTSMYSILCDRPWHLYCFGIDYDTPLVIEPAEGRTAFLSETMFTPNPDGLDSADALCQTEAEIAGLDGDFLAFLGTLGNSPASRFDVDGPPYVRTDGIPLVADAADLFSRTSELLAPISPNADATVYHSWIPIWTGATHPFTVPESPHETCGDWTEPNHDYHGGDGMVGFTYWYLNGSFWCDDPLRLLCLQQ